MFRALQIAASGMAGEQVAMDAVSNNLANTNTPAYKSTSVQFEEMLNVQDADGGASGQGVRIAGTQRDASQGAIQNTGQVLDLAINGQGYFPLTDGGGKEVYARSGSFHLDAQGRIVHLSGDVLAGGITIPTGSQNLQIATDGTVTALPPGSSSPVTLGKIELVQFSNEDGLTDEGQGVLASSDASGPALRQDASAVPLGLGSLQQGALESSNVNMVQEMVNLITTQRAYETGAKVITAADTMLADANGLVR